MQFTTSTIIAFLPFMASLAVAAPLTPSTIALAARSDIPEQCHFVNGDASSRAMVCEYATAPVFDSNFPGACVTNAAGDITCTLPEGSKDISINKPLAARAVDAEAYRLTISWKRDETSVMERAVEQEAYRLTISWKRDEAAVMARAVEQEAYRLTISW
ncbi:hypothetical protein DL98DRAFT_592389 [Cadophora sp. DSE1049]|nr:hypothetical protein DL98DRAFT_592389 [Cadophora sp. DSE1049]